MIPRYRIKNSYSSFVESDPKPFYLCLFRSDTPQNCMSLLEYKTREMWILIHCEHSCRTAWSKCLERCLNTSWHWSCLVSCSSNLVHLSWFATEENERHTYCNENIWVCRYLSHTEMLMLISLGWFRLDWLEPTTFKLFLCEKSINLFLCKHRDCIDAPEVDVWLYHVLCLE